MPIDPVVPLPRPRNLDDVYALILLVSQRLDLLSERVVRSVEGQLEMSERIGRIVAAVSGVEQSISHLRAEFTPMRERMPSVQDLERVAHKIEKSAEDIIEQAEEITHPGAEPHRPNSDPVRKLRAEEALQEKEERRKMQRTILTQVIAGVLLAVLGFVVARLLR